MKQKNVEKRLADRVAAHERLMAGGKHESKVQQRIDSGGYTRPGSRKKAG